MKLRLIYSTDSVSVSLDVRICMADGLFPEVNESAFLPKIRKEVEYNPFPST